MQSDAYCTLNLKALPQSSKLYYDWLVLHSKGTQVFFSVRLETLVLTRYKLWLVTLLVS